MKKNKKLPVKMESIRLLSNLEIAVGGAEPKKTGCASMWYQNSCWPDPPFNG